MDLPVKRFQKVAAEVADASVALPELIVEAGPGNELRPVGRYAVHPLGQPGVHVEGERRVGDAADGAVVKRDRVPAEGLLKNSLLRRTVDGHRVLWEVSSSVP